MSVIIGLAGRRGAGKSTIARRLATEHGFDCASFGDIVRQEALARSLPTSTSSLQAVGRTLIDEWGWPRFCQAVLGNIPRTSQGIIDGIRHVAAIESLRGLVAPSRFELVFIHLAEDLRLARIRMRRRVGDDDARVEFDPVEQEVDSLRSLAAFEVDGGDDKAAESIARWCRSISAERW